MITEICMVCKRVLKAGDAAWPVSHGIGECCWAKYRASIGLSVKPYPKGKA